MSGLLFETPAVCFQRWSVSFVRTIFAFATLPARWLALADRRLRWTSYRQNRAEFPAARRITRDSLGRTSWGSPAADRASLDALRPITNWLNIEDYYDISSIRERTAPFARWFPSKRGRRPFAFPRIGGQSAAEANVPKLAERIVRRQWQSWRESDHATGAQWCAHGAQRAA